MAIKKLHPWYYTVLEGGKLRPWKGDAISVIKLQRLRAQYKNVVFIENILVHALFFGDPAHPVARWDCVNGWTTRIKEAQLQYPEGKHGEVPPHSAMLQTKEELDAIARENDKVFWDGIERPFSRS